MTFRSAGIEIGDQIRFVDEPTDTTRTFRSHEELDYHPILPWILISKARHPLAANVDDVEEARDD